MPNLQMNPGQLYLINNMKDNFVLMARKIGFKGSDRQCMVVALSMQYCGNFCQGSFETHKTFLRRIFTKFKRKVDVKNHEFGWVRFQNGFFKLLNNDDKNVNKMLHSKLICCLGAGWENNKLTLIIENK